MGHFLKHALFFSLVNRILAAPLQGHETGAEHIVLINSDHPTPPRVAELLQRLDLHENHPDVKHVYNNSAFSGFAASMNSHCLDLLADMEDVSLVEQSTAINKPSSILIPSSGAFDTRGSAPWGLQRISTASSVGGDASNLDFTYAFGNSNLGSGVDIYVIDTGVYTQSNIFGGRAIIYWSFDGSKTDTDGHGTHVSGIAAGNVLGVASNANIFGMKALDPSGGGTTSTVIKAIDVTIQCHESRKNNSDYAGAVMSMSLASSERVSSLNQAIDAATKAGVHAVVAAGNDGQDACNISPSSAGGTAGPAITVGAIDIDSQRASFSNFGTCVDVYAPGVDVISAWIDGPNSVKSLTGTSMATPHVTGLVAYAMANSTLANDPALMKAYIASTALRSRQGLLLANNGVDATLTDIPSAAANNTADNQDSDCNDSER